VIEPARRQRKATVVAEPLERGFGTTLGQRAAPRAAVLAAGRAVTAVQIDGVLHEFSSIAGVREDVTDIVLNIKQLRLRMHAEGPKRMTLRPPAPAVTRRPDRAPADIEILNPDHVLCTWTKALKLRMEFTVATARAMSPPSNRPEDAPIGLIAVDSIYSRRSARGAIASKPTREGPGAGL
jgi:DNA-directed RNA polymerase subunit alpha